MPDRNPRLGRDYRIASNFSHPSETIINVRYHFSNCTDPLKEGIDALAACGEKVESARFALWADQEIVSVDDLRKTIGLCRDCRREDLPSRLVYVIYEGQDDQHD